MGFKDYLIGQMAAKAVGKDSKEGVQDIINSAVDKAKSTVSKAKTKDTSKSKASDLQYDKRAVKKALKEGKLTHTTKDSVLYDIVLPSIASLARMVGLTVDEFISSLAASYAAKTNQTPDALKAQYGTTYNDTNAANITPILKAVGTIAGTTGKEVGGIIDNAANQKKLNRDMEIFTNREALGLPNSSGMMQYYNGVQHRNLEEQKMKNEALNSKKDGISDENLKDVKDCDECKHNDNELDFETAVEMCANTGKFGDKDIFNDEDEYSEDVLDGYADNIFNHKYTYKQKATELDPNIDPNQEHIGPMAQEIEKVNPACIVEKEGYKAVDTNRLALMNAGAIADLARNVKEIKEKLNV